MDKVANLCIFQNTYKPTRNMSYRNSGVVITFDSLSSFQPQTTLQLFHLQQTMGNQDSCLSMCLEQTDDKGKTMEHHNLKSKQTIECAHLITKVISKFFNSDANLCEIRDSLNKPLLDSKHELTDVNILDYIVLFGGTVRDYKLGRPIKDIDIQVNTRELNKLHKLHLETYHKTLDQQTKTEKCVFWRLYLNKFKNSDNDKSKANNDEKCESEEDVITDIQFKHIENNNNKDKNGWEYISNCNYILNTNFIIDIILNSPPFKDKYDIKRYTGHWPSADIVINKELIYNNVDLLNTNIDICIEPIQYKCDYPDVKEADKEDIDSNQEKKVDIKESIFKYGQLRRHSSIKMMDMQMIKNEVNEQEAIEIDVPIYDTKLSSALSVCDFSINALMYPLSSFINKTAKEYYQFPNIDEFLCSLPKDYDILSDFEEQRLAHSNVRRVILAQPPPMHFLRLLKFAMRMPDWDIDDEVIENTKYCYYVWIDSDKYWNTKGLRHDYIWFIKGIFTYCGANSITRYQRMMDLFDENILNFKDKLLGVIDKYQHIKKLFVEEMNKISYQDSDQIIDLFEEHGFPTKMST